MNLINTVRNMKRTHRHLKRYYEIGHLLVRYGFHELFERLSGRHPFFLHLKKKIRPNNPLHLHSDDHSERLRMLLEALGTTFIKLGQILSTRADLIPAEYLPELARLQEKVIPLPFDQMKPVIEDALNGKLETVFREFNTKPIGSASIGQVYSAVTLDGESVIVKVQRPNIERDINTDLEVMMQIALHFERTDPAIAAMNPSAVVEEFAHSLKNELDYHVEAAYAKRLKANMADQTDIIIPKIYDQWTTKRLLVMEYIHGVSATKVMEKDFDRSAFDLKHIANIGVIAGLNQVFRDGFFHGDPHPGNMILVGTQQLALLDFGMMGRINAEERLNFVNTLHYMVRGEYETMITFLLKLTQYTVKPNLDLLTRDISELAETHMHLPINQLNIGAILQKLMVILNQYQLALRPNLYMMFKSIITLESFGKRLDPDIALLEMLKPFIRRIKLQALDPRPVMTRLVDNWGDLFDSAVKIPKTTQDILEKLRDNELEIRFKHTHLEKLHDTLKVISDRICLAIILAALIIGSSLIIHANLPPHWFGMPVIGIAGFALSGMLGVALMWVIWREKHKSAARNDD